MSANPGRIPSVDRLARDLEQATQKSVSFAVLVRAAQAAIAVARSSGDTEGSESDWVLRGLNQLDALISPSLRPAINATGVLLHTGLGRARLAPSVAESVAAVADSHANLEIDASDGRRGDRQSHVRELLQELTGAEDALVVNNCAAAVLLALASHCQGRNVILSRGQMVEIGGSYRMPEIIKAAGCHLIEVGCTNKTHPRDYTSALDDQTAAILRCHRSNFAMSGFVGEPEPAELAAIAEAAEVLFLDDLGSGCLVDTTRFGLPKERTLREAISDGADLVMASGDKLLGGPQCGLLLGRKAAIARAKAHPFARAMRIDKLSLVALEETLRLYSLGRELEIPLWETASRSGDSLLAMAQLLQSQWSCSVIKEVVNPIGGGSLPDAQLPSWRVGVRPPISANEFAALLRRQSPAIYAMVEDDHVWFDMRTLAPDELEWVRQSVTDCLA